MPLYDLPRSSSTRNTKDLPDPRGEEVKDPSLVCMAGLIVFTYFIYMYIGPGGDGAIFGSVIAAVCLLAGVKYERARKAAVSPSQLEDTANQEQ